MVSRSCSCCVGVVGAKDHNVVCALASSQSGVVDSAPGISARDTVSGASGGFYTAAIFELRIRNAELIKHFVVDSLLTLRRLAAACCYRCCFDTEANCFQCTG